MNGVDGVVSHVPAAVVPFGLSFANSVAKSAGPGSSLPTPSDSTELSSEAQQFLGSYTPGGSQSAEPEGTATASGPPKENRAPQPQKTPAVIPDSQSTLAAIYGISAPPPPSPVEPGSYDPVVQALVEEYGYPAVAPQALNSEAGAAPAGHSVDATA